MLTAIIATHESERLLVPTLAALVPLAATGFLTSVVVADGASHDGTAEIAELAGCRFMSSVQPLGSRLKSAAASTRSPWLMFLRAGVIPQVGWIDAAEHFIQKTEMRRGAAYAAVFRSPSPSDYIRPSLAEIASLLRAVMGGYPGAEQGLLIARRFYDAIGGHSDRADAERALFKRLGRRRLAVLATTVTVVRQDT
jgi:hypothetical protein